MALFSSREQKELTEQNTWHIYFTFGFLALFLICLGILGASGKFPRPVPVFDFFIMGLAVFRLTHLFVYDYIMHWVRDWFGQFGSGPGKTVANLLSCAWCTGIWMALFIGFIYFLSPLAWFLILLLALAGLGTLIDMIAMRIIRK